ncbi:GerAB/ArcD/ProY family transporter [Bacillus methanolicus]|uniref:GerAB/ArcD/ProY family transporter n=1 Tax=Bacillus methanolicus TaxID=1471 RepID=UPI002989DA99|nr:GerAB/ArcD/ProY family transporter [Bacillus methanolicus]
MSPFLVCYVIMAMQIGIGILGYQQFIAEGAGYDAWISVLITGLSLHVILWMIYKICETVNGDIVSAHTYVFGNILGKAISSLIILYYSAYAITVLRSYVEIIQVWMFHEMSTFLFSLGIILLVIYIIFGGFRTIVGIAFFSIVIPSYLIFIFLFSLKYSNFNNLLPIFDHSLKEFAISAKNMSLSYLGFEVVLYCYPFIKEPEKSKKWAHLGVLLTTLLYTGLAVLTFAFFSEEMLRRTIWPTFQMWRVAELPFVERLEYIGIATWLLIILPNICLAIWISSRLIKRIVNLKQKISVLLIAIVCLIVSVTFQTREEIKLLDGYISKAGFWFSYVYIPLLFMSVLIAKKVKGK